MNKSISTPDDTSTEYVTGKTNFKTITMTPSTIISTSANTPMASTSTTTAMLMIDVAHTSSLSTESSKIITTVIATTTMITQTVKEATIVTDWISQDLVVVGITFVLVLLFLLITLVITSCHFIGKTVTAKQCLPGIPS